MKNLDRRTFGLTTIASVALFTAPLSAQDFTLQAMEKSVSEDYDIPHLSPEQLKSLAQQSGDELVLLDVREMDEFDVSHIPSSKQIDPGMSRRKFRKTYAERLKGKHVVFYCSVGVRSSKMAVKVKKDLMKSGALGVYNLSGGIFRLHNEESIGLQSTAGEKTDFVHPYDSYWGQLLTRGQAYHRY